VELHRISVPVRKVSRSMPRKQQPREVSNREQLHFRRELHDGLCQSLAGIAALSSALSKDLAASGDTAASAAAAEIALLLHETAGAARDLAHGLVPTGLKESDLACALAALAGNIQRQFGISCAVRCDRARSRICPQTELHLHRIAQEAVSNAIEHGRADRIEIDLVYRAGQGSLRVRDNGFGLPKDVRNCDGMGLRTMDCRARSIGGSFDIERHPRRGTVVTCLFPLRST
jgi:two-component system sensor kinase FixL